MVKLSKLRTYEFQNFQMFTYLAVLILITINSWKTPKPTKFGFFKKATLNQKQIQQKPLGSEGIHGCFYNTHRFNDSTLLQHTKTCRCYYSLLLLLWLLFQLLLLNQFAYLEWIQVMLGL